MKLFESNLSHFLNIGRTIPVRQLGGRILEWKDLVISVERASSHRVPAHIVIFSQWWGQDQETCTLSCFNFSETRFGVNMISLKEVGLGGPDTLGMQSGGFTVKTLEKVVVSQWRTWCGIRLHFEEYFWRRSNYRQPMGLRVVTSNITVILNNNDLSC